MLEALPHQFAHSDHPSPVLEALPAGSREVLHSEAACSHPKSAHPTGHGAAAPLEDGADLNQLLS